MRRAVVLAGCLLVAGVLRAAETKEAPAVRFETVKLLLNSGETPLAAWQAEVRVESGDARIVGVEDGEHPAFRKPAYYDPAARQGGRIILAAFSTAKDLPKGKTRVATLHFAVRGGETPRYSIRTDVAADAYGKPVPATATLSKGDSE